METLRKLIEFDISEKEVVRKIIRKAISTQAWIISVGVILILSIFLNFYFTSRAVEQIKGNRIETLKNRAHGDTIIMKIDSLLKRK